MATSESTEKVLTGPIKIYKDKVVISNLTLSEDGEVNGIDASQIGAATVNQLNSLSTTVSNNYSTLNNKFSNYLPLSGGKITNGNLNIENGSLSIDQFGQEGNAWISVENEAGKILFGVSKDTYKKGIYDSNVGKWLVYIDDNQQVSLNGNAASATTLTGLAASVEELNYVDGVTSNVQEQINNLNTNLSNYLPLSGGTLTGNITVGQSADTESRWVRACNEHGTVYLNISYAGNRGVYDDDFGWIIRCNKNGNITIPGYPTFTYDANTKTLTLTTQN